MSETQAPPDTGAAAPEPTGTATGGATPTQAHTETETSPSGAAFAALRRELAEAKAEAAKATERAKALEPLEARTTALEARLTEVRAARLAQLPEPIRAVIPENLDGDAVDAMLPGLEALALREASASATPRHPAGGRNSTGSAAASPLSSSDIAWVREHRPEWAEMIESHPKVVLKLMKRDPRAPKPAAT